MILKVSYGSNLKKKPNFGFWFGQVVTNPSLTAQKNIQVENLNYNLLIESQTRAENDQSWHSVL